MNDTVTWYRRAIAESGLPESVMRVLGPLLRPSDSVLDLGCGPGTLTIPLARQVRQVTALDANDAMLEGLRTELAQAQLENVTIVHGEWPEAAAALEPHDVLIAANVAPIVRDMDTFVHHARRLSDRVAAMILGAGDRSNKFFNQDLRRHLGLPPKENTRRGADYLEQYAALHDRGIYANVQIIAYDFDQPFEDWADAVAFHRAHLRLETHEHDAAIESFLRERLVENANGPRLPMPKQSAVIWWEWDVAQATAPA